jgi:CBS domain containing-hemolysin-like protein
MRLDQAAPVVGAWRGGSETVAAHIVAALGRVPDTSERVVVDGLEVEIEVVEAGTIASVIVGTPHTEAEPAE